MRLVGLTGGIASGKSSVARILQEEGCSVLSCDVAAREVVEQGCPGYNKVLAEFGSDILLPSGEIDRSKLGSLIFNNPGNRDRLNKCIHPEIAKSIRRQIIYQFIKGVQLVVIDIPLLYESCNINPLLHSIVVVYCTPEQQKQRLMERNDLTAEEADSRISSQMSIEEKREKANHVVDNSGLFQDTEYQVIALLPTLRAGIIPIRNIAILLILVLVAVFLSVF